MRPVTNGGSLDRLPDGRAELLRWPPSEGRFILAFNAATAARVRQEGGLTIDGKRARIHEVWPGEPRIIDFLLEAVAA